MCAWLAEAIHLLALWAHIDVRVLFRCCWWIGVVVIGLYSELRLSETIRCTCHTLGKFNERETTKLMEIKRKIWQDQIAKIIRSTLLCFSFLFGLYFPLFSFSFSRSLVLSLCLLLSCFISCRLHRNVGDSSIFVHCSDKLSTGIIFDCLTHLIRKYTTSYTIYIGYKIIYIRT